MELQLATDQVTRFTTRLDHRGVPTWVFQPVVVFRSPKEGGCLCRIKPACNTNPTSNSASCYPRVAREAQQTMRTQMSLLARHREEPTRFRSETRMTSCPRSFRTLTSIITCVSGRCLLKHTASCSTRVFCRTEACSATAFITIY